jgi:hypothetical protein
MVQVSTLVGILLVLPSLTAATSQTTTKTKPKTKTERLTKEARLDVIRRARVWTPTDVRSRDLRAGPGGPGAFPPGALVECEYSEAKLKGSSPKFGCIVDEADTLKVRYGETNGEVEGMVLASRLLWALGFGADRVYPVRVLCHGCPPDPWKHPHAVAGSRSFEPAVIERPPEGRELKAKDDSGWSWTEIDLVDESRGGASPAQVDAFKLLAAFIQHSDSKAAQQRLWCPPGAAGDDGACKEPLLMIHDVGITFGHATYANRQVPSSVNLHEWSETPVWKDAEKCIAYLSRSHTGTLENPKIHEAGRAFLADLLAGLTDDQLYDLFDVAQVARRRTSQDPEKPVPGVEDWVRAFKAKRSAITEHHCLN